LGQLGEKGYSRLRRAGVRVADSINGRSVSTFPQIWVALRETLDAPSAAELHVNREPRLTGACLNVRDFFVGAG
jgi:hypothetical protein